LFVGAQRVSKTGTYVFDTQKHIGNMGNSSARTHERPVLSFESANQHIAELTDPQDRCNAQAILTELRIIHDQPRGWTAVNFQARGRVMEYFRLHGVHVFNQQPKDDTWHSATVIV